MSPARYWAGFQFAGNSVFESARNATRWGSGPRRMSFRVCTPWVNLMERSRPQIFLAPSHRAALLLPENWSGCPEDFGSSVIVWPSLVMFFLSI